LINIYNFHGQYVPPHPLSYAFAFPQHHPASFKLLTGSTVGYLADSIFYKLDLHTGKAEALQYHPTYPVTPRAGPTRPLPLCPREASPCWLTTDAAPISTFSSPKPIGIFKSKISVLWKL